MRLVDVVAGEDVPDLADTVDGLTGLADECQVVRLLRLQREVVAVGGALVASRLTGEGPRDDSADGMLAREDLACDLAPSVQLVERDRVHMGRDLEDRICRRVDDPLAGSLVFLPE